MNGGARYGGVRMRRPASKPTAAASAGRYSYPQSPTGRGVGIYSEHTKPSGLPCPTSRTRPLNAVAVGSWHGKVVSHPWRNLTETVLHPTALTNKQSPF